MSGDFFIPTPMDVASPSTINIDQATEIIFKKLGWPLLGGPSGRGWSMVSTAQRCGELFFATYDAPAVRDKKAPIPFHPEPLQIGALYHTLQALYYGAGLGNAYVLPRRGGLLADNLTGPRAPSTRARWTVPPDAADVLLAELKAMCNAPGEDVLAPKLNIVLEAERLFDAHTYVWGNGKEDCEPLAIELFAEDPNTGYSCRFDAVVKVGPNDPYMPPGVVIKERKTTAWISEKYIEGWKMDGEVLGQLAIWEAAGLDKIFGPLVAIVVDVVSKGKIPDVRRILLPPKMPAVQRHRQWVKHTQAEIAMWRATGIYPQRFASCFGRYGLCPQWTNCVTKEE